MSRAWQAGDDVYSVAQVPALAGDGPAVVQHQHSAQGIATAHHICCNPHHLTSPTPLTSVVSSASRPTGNRGHAALSSAAASATNSLI